MFGWTKQPPVILPSACEQHRNGFRINMLGKNTLSTHSDVWWMYQDWVAASLSTAPCLCQSWERLWKSEKYQIWKLTGVPGMLLQFLIATVLSRHFQSWRNQWKFRKHQHFFTFSMCKNGFFCRTSDQDGKKNHGLSLLVSMLISLSHFMHAVWVTGQAWSGSSLTALYFNAMQHTGPVLPLSLRTRSWAHHPDTLGEGRRWFPPR